MGKSCGLLRDEDVGEMQLSSDYRSEGSLDAEGAGALTLQRESRLHICSLSPHNIYGSSCVTINKPLYFYAGVVLALCSEISDTWRSYKTVSSKEVFNT